MEEHKRRDAADRQAIARAALGDLPHTSHPASYFVWLPLPPDTRADRVVATLAAHRISVSTAEPFATTGHPPQAIRIALGSADADRLSATVRTVADVVALDAFA